MAATAARPNLTVDVGLATSTGRNPRQNNRAVVHAARSARAPQQQQQQADSDRGGFSSDEDAGGVGARGGAYDDASLDDDGVYRDQHYTHHAHAQYDDRHHVELEGDDEHERALMDVGPGGELLDPRDRDRSDEEDMDDEDDEDLDDEDDDDLSSSPSIPDENIDFDLVYALHTFCASVEGQATVNKGNSLTLLDDSNSYW